MPEGTFGPKSVTSPGSLGRTTVSTPVFDINLLTFNTSETEADVNFLASQVSAPSDVQLFELGNEFYVTHFQYRFPNSSTYMEAAAPIVSQARGLFPDALMLAVAL